MFKYILFDLDNTIYDYEESNNNALNEIISKMSNDFKLDKDILENEYKKEIQR